MYRASISLSNHAFHHSKFQVFLCFSSTTDSISCTRQIRVFKYDRYLICVTYLTCMLCSPTVYKFKLRVFTWSLGLTRYHLTYVYMYGVTKGSICLAWVLLYIDSSLLISVQLRSSYTTSLSFNNCDVLTQPLHSRETQLHEADRDSARIHCIFPSGSR